MAHAASGAGLSHGAALETGDASLRWLMQSVLWPPPRRATALVEPISSDP
jgi:hypothetical protein